MEVRSHLLGEGMPAVWLVGDQRTNVLLLLPPLAGTVVYCWLHLCR
jgi:hypothetical protein